MPLLNPKKQSQLEDDQFTPWAFIATKTMRWSNSYWLKALLFFFKKSSNCQLVKLLKHLSVLRSLSTTNRLLVADLNGNHEPEKMITIRIFCLTLVPYFSMAISCMGLKCTATLSLQFVHSSMQKFWRR